VAGQVFGFEHGGSRRYAEAINRLFQMESGDAPLPPGFILELDRPEWRFLKREKLWSSGALLVAGAVGNFSRAQIINPSGSGYLVVVTLAKVFGLAGGTTVTLATDGAIIVAGQATNTALDMRVPLTSGGTARGTISRNAIANNLPGQSGIVIDRFVVPAGAANDGFATLLPIIMPPNTTVELTVLVANTAGNFVFGGYERPATPDELAL